MQTLLITNCRRITRTGIEPDQAVLIQSGRIASAGPAGRLEPVGSNTQVIDGGGRYLAPGYIDLHTHGSLGHLLDNGPDQLSLLSRDLPRFGVTGFLPSLTPLPDATAGQELSRLRSYAQAAATGTAVLGFFLEGHFLALTGSLSSLPHHYTTAWVDALSDALQPYPVVFGVSPEIEGLPGLLPAMTRQSGVAFITHTRASVAQTEQAIACGARHATHFYDVFPYPGDREPGVRGCGAVETILASPETSVDFILDGEHVDPVAVRMSLAALGPDRVCLITDANLNAGLPPGSYTSMNGQTITVAYPGAPARLGPDTHMPGGLNGSGLTLDRAVRHARQWLNVSLPQAVAMASANPARVLGLEQRKGRVELGYDADLILLDEQLAVTDCWAGGRHVYSESGAV